MKTQAELRAQWQHWNRYGESAARRVERQQQEHHQRAYTLAVLRDSALTPEEHDYALAAWLECRRYRAHRIAEILSNPRKRVALGSVRQRRMSA